MSRSVLRQLWIMSALRVVDVMGLPGGRRFVYFLSFSMDALLRVINLGRHTLCMHRCCMLFETALFQSVDTVLQARR